MTTEIIIDRLHEIETQNDIKILMAVESGSRAWGFESPESDWDVRFVYINKFPWYLSIKENKKRTIEKMYNDDIDASGWELGKALGLMYKSNPSLSEWINSPIKYICDEDFFNDFKELNEMCFNSSKTKYHYGGIMAKNEKYITDHAPLKKFMYYLRAILCCKYIDIYNMFPPVRFVDVIDSTVNDDSVKKMIFDIIELKSKSKENDLFEVDPKLVEFAMSNRVYCDPDTSWKKYDTDNRTKLNEFMYYVLTNWNKL